MEEVQVAYLFGLGMQELLIILIIFLLIFGASRLPELGSSLGKAIKGFKESVSGKDAIDVTPHQREAEGKEGKKEERKA